VDCNEDGTKLYANFDSPWEVHVFSNRIQGRNVFVLWRVGLWFAISLSACLCACGTIPRIDLDKAANDSKAPPQVMGTRGPLSVSQSRTILERISTEAGDAGMLDRHLAIEQAIAETPLIEGNRTRILRDGGETFNAVFTAIDRAKHHVNLEYYILEDIERDAVHLSDLLIAKQASGVTVNVIYDSFGSLDTPAGFFDKLKQAGIKVLEFNPVNPLNAKNDYSPNDRDHRKILVVDGATAIIGGVNLSKTYQTNPLGSSGPSEEAPSETWRDTAMQIDGPVVSQVQSLFLEQWTAQSGPPLDTETFFPKVPPQGQEIARIIGSTPDHETPRYYVTLLSALQNAEKSIDLTASYFVPTEQERRELIAAAARGVRVRLLLPDRSDSRAALSVGRSHYTALLDAGVSIWETQNVVLHSKTVVIDGVWSVIGSSNFDHRSIIFNDEIDAVVLGRDTAQAMQRMFEDDLARAIKIDPVEWGQRSLFQRLEEIIFRLGQTLL